MSSESVSFFPLRFLFFIIYVIMSVSISDQHPDIYRLKNHFHVSLFSSGDGASDVVLNWFVPILSRTVCLQSQLFFGPVIGKLQLKTEHSRVRYHTRWCREWEKNKPSITYVFGPVDRPLIKRYKQVVWDWLSADRRQWALFEQVGRWLRWLVSARSEKWGGHSFTFSTSPEIRQREKRAGTKEKRKAWCSTFPVTSLCVFFSRHSSRHHKPRWEKRERERELCIAIIVAFSGLVSVDKKGPMLSSSPFSPLNL